MWKKGLIGYEMTFKMQDSDTLIKILFECISIFVNVIYIIPIAKGFKTFEGSKHLLEHVGKSEI